MKRLAVVSLGCAKNLVDTEIMLGQLLGDGWEMTDDFSQAELILVNTCGFIEKAKKESIDQILELAEYKTPIKGRCERLVVSGCLVQRYSSELAAEIPEVDFWINLGEIGEIAKIIKNKRQPQVKHTQKQPFLNELNLPRFQATLRHTAYVKIAEGCNHCCSYCAIPIIKGKFRSRSLESIVKEIHSLVQAGVKEINLIAQDITKYGEDLTPKINLRILLEEIITRANPVWLRLLYAYPSGIDEDLLQLINTQTSICKYIDLPLQHISSRILKLMNRPEEPKSIKEKLWLIREKVPDITLRTTFLVGFPSETDKEFNELLEFVAAGYFNHIGVFEYSREEGTKSFNLEPQVPNSIKEKRKELLLREQQRVSFNYLARQVEQEKLVLVDKVLADGSSIGRSQYMAPEVDGVVYLNNYAGKAGQFTKAIITGNDNYNLFAKVN